MRKKLFNCRHFCGITLLLTLGVATQAQVPEFVWVKQVGSKEDEYSTKIKIDAQHNIYSIGILYDTTTLDFSSTKLIGHKGGDAYLIKQDSSGGLIWARVLPTNVQAIDLALAPSGKEVYITGEWLGTVDFDPGTGTETRTSVTSSRGSSSRDFFVSKFDSAGNFKWVRTAGSAGAESGKGLVVDNGSQHVYVTGTFTAGTVDFGFGQTTANLTSAGGGTFIVKITEGGSFVWAKGYTGSGSVYANGITVDKTGDAYITGYYSSTVDFDPDPNNTANLTSLPGQNDIFVSKLTASGTYVWAKSMGGPDYDHGNAVVVDDSFNVYVTGGFQSTCNFDPNGGTHFLATNGGKDAFVMKLKPDGALSWAGNVGSRTDDEGNDIVLDEFGNVYTCGDFQSPSSDFDPGSGTFNLVSYGGYDGYALKLDNDGKFKWARNIGTKFGPDGMSGIDVRNGCIYTTGVFYNTADFDPAGGGLHQLTTKGNADIYILKLFECLHLAEADVTIKGPDSVCFNQTYTYAIDPVEGALSYEWEIPGHWQGSSDSIRIVITTDTETEGFIRVKARGVCDSTIKELTIYPMMLPAEITINEFELSTTNTSYYKTWQWYLDGKKIEGATNATLDVTENGMYSVVVTGGADCRDSAWYEVTNVETSVKTIRNNRYVSVYPNPVTDFVQVYNKTGMSLEVAIISIDGRELSKEIIRTAEARIDMHSYSRGVYVLQIRGDKEQLLQVEKIIKK